LNNSIARFSVNRQPDEVSDRDRFVDGQAYAVLINARKGQRLFPEHLRFLARGVYELHCIDDPNDPIPLIIDVSEHEKGKGRTLRA
jgi:hypothetical protein